MLCYIGRWDIPLSELQRCSWLSELWQHISGLDMCCSLYLTLDQQVVFSVAWITGVANLPLRMWSSSKKHQLLFTWAPGPGVEPGSMGHKADALPLSYPHIFKWRIYFPQIRNSTTLLEVFPWVWDWNSSVNFIFCSVKKCLHGKKYHKRKYHERKYRERKYHERKNHERNWRKERTMKEIEGK